jgi:hypothetical protein
MNQEILAAYLSIFDVNPQDCQLVGVKLIGKTLNHANDNVYRFVGIVVCPVPSIIGDIIPTQNEMTQIKNYARRKLEDIGGPDIVKKVVWKVKKKNGKKKKKHFDFTAHIDVSSVMDFEIIDGVYYIKVETYGLFYD